VRFQTGLTGVYIEKSRIQQILIGFGRTIFNDDMKRLPNVKVQPIELLSVEALSDCLRTQYPEMLIVLADHESF